MNETSAAPVVAGQDDITRIAVEITRADGRFMRFAADRPERAEFSMSAPVPPWFDERPLDELRPVPMRNVAVSFEAHPHRPVSSETWHSAPERLTLSRADLEAVYDYARHFDVDDDPSMNRVRALLGL